MTQPAVPSSFSVTVILPAIDETWSLRETLTRIEAESRNDVSQYLIVVCDKTTPECRQVAEALVLEVPGRVQLLEQRLPFLGGAVRDGFDAATGSHVDRKSTRLNSSHLG